MVARKLLTALSLAAVPLAACSAQAAHSPKAAPRSPKDPSTTAEHALAASRAAFRLPAPLSRTVAVPAGSTVLLLGGLDSGQRTTTAIVRLDPRTGRSTTVGNLAVPVHDAGGAMLHGHVLVAGGGAGSSVDTVQAYTPGAATSTVVGHLPRPRSDDAMAVSGDTAYVVGGYDGSRELPDVLATTDGRSFHVVAQLHTTVRYPAVVAAPGALWVLGGEHHGTPVSDIQKVDLTTGHVTVTGQLPTPLAHAMVLTVNGRHYLAGGTGDHPSDTVYAVDPHSGAVRVAGSLPVATTDAGATAVGDTAYVLGGSAQTAEQSMRLTDAVVQLRDVDVTTATGRTPHDPHAFTGQLLIADRGNNRLLLVSPDRRVVWHFPRAGAPAPPSGFYFPDDAFFTHHGTGIISNQEGNDTVVEIGYPSGRSTWAYGHPGHRGTAPGYLNDPDDAYLLANGQVAIADANNCRVVIVGQDHQVQHTIGTPGRCVHAPPAALGYPNGDTPLRNGNLLISEVHGSWVSEYTPTGRLVWTVRLPAVSYVSDPQQLGADDYLVADYARPGGVVEFNRKGRILWEYHVSSGPGMLDHPSLAERLPNGDICVNDDYRHRVVIIDPKTKQIVWQFGLTDVSGTAPGLLNTPDGFDLRAPDGTSPTHPWTG